MSRRFLLFIALLSFALAITASRADTFELNDHTTQAGTIASFDQNGLVLRDDAGNYSDRIGWGKFSQDDLKKLAQNPKIAPLVEPFIDEPVSNTSHPEITVKPVERLERPGKTSLIGAMFSSSVGLMVLLLVYIANVYAGYEIARFRQRPAGLVCGVSAVLPIIGPAIFLWMPSYVQEPEYVAPEVTASQQQTFAVATPPAESRAPIAAQIAARQAAEQQAAAGSAEAPAGNLHLAPSAHDQTSNIPETQTFSRGQFMFNRRFFETKFPGFFGMVKRASDRDMVLVFKTARGEYIGQRIARISANELHLQVEQGDASAEIMIPFNDIREIQLKHKNA